MEKEKLKTETHYSHNFKVKGEFETLDIIQEENVIGGREAIKLKFFEERWRTPEETIEMLKKIIIILEKYFIN